MATQDVHLGMMTLQPRRQLLANGSPVPLGRKPLDILSVLADAEGGLVTKDELMAAIWPGLVVEENAIHAHMVVLRRALGSEAERLKTVHGFGYRLETSAPGRAAPPRRDAAAEQPSVAVLPFVNLTGDPARDYLSDGMAEELICTLARGSDLKVPARTSVFAYKGRDGDIRQIARELGVATVLEGSVRAAGTRVRVTAQLIEAEGGYHLWSANYDRDLTDMIALQEEIAEAIAQVLRSKLADRKPRTTDPEAHSLFLRGRSLLDRGSVPNLLKAVELLEEAVRRDPSYADARTALSRALTYCCSSGAMEPERYAEAREQARIACQIDPSDAGAHSLFGCGNARKGDWVTAARHLQRAIDLYETDPDLHCVYGGGFLLFAGHARGAAEHGRRAKELAPASALANLVCASTAQFVGDHAAAEACLAAAAELGFPEGLQPFPALKTGLALARRDHAEAARWDVAAWREHLGPSGTEAVQLAYQAAAGERPRDAAASALGELITRAEAEHWVPRHMGVASHLLLWSLVVGERRLTHAVADLVLAGWSRTGVLDIGAFVPLWSAAAAEARGDLLEDPRLQQVFEKVGLRAYWDAFGPPDAFP